MSGVGASWRARAGGASAGWRLRIRHRTGFRYAGEVGSAYNEARMTPQTEPGQTTVDARIEVRPAASTYRCWNYWGTWELLGHSGHGL
jgi:hypothetical protein